MVNEWGWGEGVVSPADVLTAIAGELTAGPDESAAEATQRADGSWLVDGRMEIHRAERILGLRDQEQVTTDKLKKKGFILRGSSATCPAAGEAFVKFGLRFEVVDLDGRRIDKVLVEQVDGPARSRLTRWPAWGDLSRTLSGDGVEVGEVPHRHDALVIRRARASDSDDIARVHVQSWRKAYRGLLPQATWIG